MVRQAHHELAKDSRYIALPTTRNHQLTRVFLAVDYSQNQADRAQELYISRFPKVLLPESTVE